MKSLLAITFLFALVFTLNSCETIKGMGKDLQNTGDNIQEGVSRTN